MKTRKRRRSVTIQQASCIQAIARPPIKKIKTHDYHHMESLEKKDINLHQARKSRQLMDQLPVGERLRVMLLDGHNVFTAQTLHDEGIPLACMEIVERVAKTHKAQQRKLKQLHWQDKVKLTHGEMTNRLLQLTPAEYPHIVIFDGTSQDLDSETLNVLSRIQRNLETRGLPFLLYLTLTVRSSFKKCTFSSRCDRIQQALQNRHDTFGNTMIWPYRRSAKSTEMAWFEFASKKRGQQTMYRFQDGKWPGFPEASDAPTLVTHPDV